MKSFLVLPFFLLLFNQFSFSQKTDKLPGEIVSDTIEGISTDTSIVYIIKKPAVTIRERVEIEKTRKKQYYYLSLGANGFLYSQKTKASSGYGNYVKTLDKLTRSLPSFALEVKLWKAPEKTVTGISISATRILQQFNYTDTLGHSYRIVNNFNYCNVGFFLGRWLRKGSVISYIPHAGVQLDYFISTKGLTLNKSDLRQPSRLNRVMHYTPYNASFNAGYMVLIALKNSFLEIEPYFIFSPFSATKHTEVFSLTRSFLGLRIGYTNKLF